MKSHHAITNGCRWATARRRDGIIGALIVLALALPAAAKDRNDRVRPDQVPPAPRGLMEREVAGNGGRDVVFYHWEDGHYSVHYTLPSGLRLETKVRREGTLIVTAPTNGQPVLRPAEVGPAYDRYVADRQRAEAAAAEAQRQEAARAQFEADRAARAAGRDDAAFRAGIEAEREAQRRRDDEARADHARRLAEREAADWYAERRYERVEPGQLTGAANTTFRDVIRGGTDVVYFRFTKGAARFFAADYTTVTGRRVKAVVDEDGRLTDRIELADRPIARVEVRDRDLAWDREHAWARDRVNRWWMPERTRLVLEERIVGATDVDYLRFREGTRTLYAVRYTTADGRRVETHATAEGQLLDTVVLFEPRVVR